MTAPDTVMPENQSPEDASAGADASTAALDVNVLADDAADMQPGDGPTTIPDETNAAEATAAVPLAADPTLAGPEVEAVIEAALDDDLAFVGLVRDAVGQYGGEILFELDHDPRYGHVAAVQMGDGDQRQFAMVIKPVDGGPLRVEPAAESEHPLAAIMQSYAGLVDAWKKAA